MLHRVLKRYFVSMQPNMNIKKFYKNVTIEKNENPLHQMHNYIIKLDGKQIRTPNRNLLCVPTYDLGMALASEFHIQNEYLKPHNMPLFALSRTAIDVDFDSNLRGHLETAILQYFENDTICHREDKNTKLGELQEANLDPILNYINKLLGLTKKVNYGLDTSKNTENEINKILQFLQNYNNWKLLSVEFAAANLKSTSLSLALMTKRLQIEEALDLSRLEENYQITLFGEVEGSHDLDEATTRMNISAAKNFFSLSQYQKEGKIKGKNGKKNK